MSLEEYRRKRVFSKTPEPPPKASAAQQNRFFIQRHSARRLHYDLRLEMDGVLRSWALPQGPTLDPDIKRLAVHVEDHPLDYGNFEGTIPSGNYGAGQVTLWDRGTFEWLTDKPPEAQWQGGDLKLRFHGQKIVGEFALVRTKRNKGKDWLLIKKKDFAVRPGWDPESDIRSVLQTTTDVSQVEGAGKAAMPAKLEPMLATLTTTLPSGSDWLYEVKWDGYRALCFLENGKVHMTSRRGNPMEGQFPEVAKAIAESVKAESAILDGEIVALDENGVPSFQLMQNYTGFRRSAALKGEKPQSLNFFAFDLIYLNGYDLRKASLIDRRQLLSSIILPNQVVRYSEHFAGRGQELMEAVRAKGLEGVVAKQAQSRYESRRSSCWLKVKVTCQQDFIICGFILGEREPFGSLVLGYYKDGQLTYAGNVGSGFNQQSLKLVHEKLKPLLTKKPVLTDVPRETGQVTWAKPELVCVVKFSSWTADERLRAPVFQGLRSDASPQDVVRETGQDVEVAAGVAGRNQKAPEAQTQNQSNAKPNAKSKAKPQALPSAAVQNKALQNQTQPAPRQPLLSPDVNEISLDIGRHRLKFTNLKKVFYPADGYSKRDLINYYDAVSHLLLPHLAARPLSLRRYPNGIDGESFFQKEAAASFPAWLHTELIRTDEENSTRFVVCDDLPSLLFLANLGCIDQNPWMSRLGTLENPDFILIDLDPYHCAFDRIIEAAQLVRQKLDLIGLRGYPKTTGGDGMHVYIPLEPHYTYAQSRSFAEILARWVIAERPELFTTPRNVAARQKGKVYFDWMQNAEGKTISAPYVVRAYPGAPVATPLRWDEVQPGLKPIQFHIANVMRRFDRVGDLFSPVLTQPQQMEPALEKLSKLMSG
ncbi:MAG TPA: DNA ligase D [Candidatus Limnocylindrales bacterium]|nr:DNA ligase D [Candidatus Limnocylindrales bacterium]